jgi:hypothetical protein
MTGGWHTGVGTQSVRHRKRTQREPDSEGVVTRITCRCLCWCGWTTGRNNAIKVCFSQLCCWIGVRDHIPLHVQGTVQQRAVCAGQTQVPMTALLPHIGRHQLIHCKQLIVQRFTTGVFREDGTVSRHRQHHVKHGELAAGDISGGQDTDTRLPGAQNTDDQQQ